MIPSELPHGWVWTTLGDICSQPQYGWTTKSTEFGSVHLLRTTDITSGNIDWKTVPYCQIIPPDKEKYLLNEGDIVISRAGSVGFSSFIKNPPESVFASYLIRFKPLIDVHFFSCFLKSPLYWQSIREKSIGIALANVNASKLNQIHVPLPPIQEQHRIVTKIEELFTQLDAGVTSLKKVQAQLKRYRQAVLKAAFEGKLTQEWREHHKGEIDTSNLLKEIKTEKQTSGSIKLKELPSTDDDNLQVTADGWISVRIGNVVEFLDHKRIPVNKEERAKRRGDIPYYGANGRVDWIDDFIFDEPLVLVVEDETFVGRQIPFSYKITGKSWVNNHAHVLRAKKFVNADFLNYSLMFYPFTQMTSGMTGRRKLTKFALINAPYILPSKNEQLQIVSEIERHFSLIDHLEHTIEKSLKQAESLRQSILKRAFEGKLVTQDPSEEPASVLLERIKVEKAHTAEVKKGKQVQTNSPKRKIKHGN